MRCLQSKVTTVCVCGGGGGELVPQQMRGLQGKVRTVCWGGGGTCSTGNSK